MVTRVPIPDFQIANALYAGAQVTFFTVEDGEKTAVAATLYAAPTGATTISNPVTLDGYGKFQTIPYIEEPVIGAITGITGVDDHDTGIIYTLGSWRGDWATATDYYPGDIVRDGAAGTNTTDLYRVVSTHTSGVWATDSADATKLVQIIDVAGIAGVLPTPSDPGDDGKPLIAGGGASSWTASNTVIALLAAANQAAARSAIGAQASDAELAAIAALVSAANKIIRFTGSGTADLLDFLDEDNMASNSATGLASQQSIVAYIAAQLAGIDPGLTAQSEVTATGSPVVLSDGAGATAIPAGTKRILISFNGTGLSGSDDLILQLGYGATPTWVTSGYSTTTSSDDAGGSIDSTAGFIIKVGTNTFRGQMMLTLQDAVNNVWVASHVGEVGPTSCVFGGGQVALSGVLSSLRIDADGTDTIDAGAITVMYE